MTLVSKSNFKKFINIVIVTVYALILIGGIVRSTGSGLGCPDWPTCFGQMIPPTDVSQLPADYKTQFAIQGKEIANFSAVKTWTEYLNRLFGMMTGFFILILAGLSFAYKKTDKRIFWLSQINLAAVIFQGWLGAVVVSSLLKPLIITAHMVMAIVIVFFLLQTKKYLSEEEVVANRFNEVEYKSLNKIGVILMVLTMVQVVLGTQVRETIDYLSKELVLDRSLWLDKMTLKFYVHRSYSLIIFLLQSFFTYKILKSSIRIPKISFNAYGMMFSIGLSLFSGIALAYFEFPKSMQPVHLLASVMVMGFQYTCWCYINLHAPVKAK